MRHDGSHKDRGDSAREEILSPKKTEESRRIRITAGREDGKVYYVAYHYR